MAPDPKWLRAICRFLAFEGQCALERTGLVLGGN